MPRQSEATLTAIKHAVDIVALIGEVLPVIRAGSKYKSLCPFHDDHNPSMEISPERQTFKCWACGAGGDVFDFVQKFEKVEFPEAMTMLAERAGISLEAERGRSPEGARPEVSRSQILEVLAWAQDRFREELTRNPEAMEYLHRRGIEETSWSRFALGFAPDRRDWLIGQGAKVGHGVELLEAAGLVARSPETGAVRDRFRGRIIFPIQDLRGRPVAFGGRILPSVELRLKEADLRAAKYLNSPETAVFQKRRTLYAAEQARTAARQAGWIAVVEGYTDVIALHQAGIPQVVGTLGTALGDDHVQILRRLADRVVLVFDGDVAGQTAADRSLELFLGREVDLRVLTLPEGLDPADFALQENPETLVGWFAGAEDPLEFAIKRAAARYDFQTAEGARQAASWVLSIVARIPRSSRSGLDLKLAKSLDVLSRRLGLSVNDLNRTLQTLRRARRTEARTTIPESDGVETARVVDLRTLDALERELVSIVLAEPASVPRLVTRLAASSLSDADLRGILQAAFDLYAQCEDPTFDRILHRLDQTGRSLAVSLVSPQEPGRLPDSLQPAPWDVRLTELEFRLAERDRQNRLRDLRTALAQADPRFEPETFEALRREFLTLNQQRITPRLTPSA